MWVYRINLSTLATDKRFEVGYYIANEYQEWQCVATFTADQEDSARDLVHYLNGGD